MLAVQYALIFQFMYNIQGAEDSKSKEKFENKPMTFTHGDGHYTICPAVYFRFSALHDEVMESVCYKNDNYALSISRLNFLLAIVQNLDYIRKNAKNNAKDMTVNDPSPLHKQRIEDAVSEMNKAFEVKQSKIHDLEASTAEFEKAFKIMYSMQKSVLDKDINDMKRNAYKTASEVAELKDMYQEIKQEHEFTCRKLAIDVSDDVKKSIDEIEGFFRDEVTDQEPTKMAKGTTQEEERRN